MWSVPKLKHGHVYKDIIIYPTCVQQLQTLLWIKRQISEKVRKKILSKNNSTNQPNVAADCANQNKTLIVIFDVLTVTNRTEKLERKQRDGLRSTTRTSSPPATAPLTSPMLTSHWRSSSTLLVIRWRKNHERLATKRSNWRGLRRRREGTILTLQSWRRRRIWPSQAICPGGRLEKRRAPLPWLALRSPGTKAPTGALIVMVC